MTSAARRSRGIRRHGARRAALQALVDAGGHMELGAFKVALSRIYGSPGSMSNAFNQLRDNGFTQHRVYLTASGSALLSKTEPTGLPTDSPP